MNQITTARQDKTMSITKLNNYYYAYHAISDEGQQPAAVKSINTHGNMEARKSLGILAFIFATSLLAMFYVYLMFPELDE